MTRAGGSSSAMVTSCMLINDLGRVPSWARPYFIKGGQNMNDYENAILNMQDNDVDECANCPHKNDCKNQCSEVVSVYNPNLQRLIE